GGGEGGDGPGGGGLDRIAEDAGADARKRERQHAVRSRDLDRAPVARGEQLGLAAGAVAPDRTDRVDDEPRRQPIPPGELGVAGLAAAKQAALVEQLRPGGAVDGAVDPATPAQRRGRRVDDGADRERPDA